MAIVDSFGGVFRFLSNRYPAPVTYRGRTYTCAEAALAAQKQPTGEVLLEILRAKFTEPRLASRLLDTGDVLLTDGDRLGGLLMEVRQELREGCL